MDDDNQERVKCQCGDCGKKFYKGDEGDNEQFCLRCERESVLNRAYPASDDFWERDDYTSDDY
jgi:acetyl-CoA carboxylase beta subunit